MVLISVFGMVCGEVGVLDRWVRLFLFVLVKICCVFMVWLVFKVVFIV